MARRFNDLSLRVKMALGPIFLIVALIGLAGYSLQLLDRDQRALEELSERGFKRAALLAALDSEVKGIHARLYQLSSVAANDSDLEKAKTMAEALRKDLAGIGDRFAAAAASLASDADSALLREAMGKTLKDYADAGAQVVEMSGNASYALIFMASAQEAFDKFLKQEAELRATVDRQKQALIEQTRARAHDARIIFIAATLLVVIIAGAATLLLGNLISRPVVAIAASLRRLAEGDLAIETAYAGRRDEIGAIAHALGVFKDTAIAAEKLTAERERQREQQERRAQRLADLARHFDQEVTGALALVGKAATELQSTAEAMAAAAKQTTAQSSAAMAAAQQAAHNVSTVASAAEELASSVEEIGRQVALSTSVAGKAVDEASKTNRTIKSLAEASEKIGAVVALINNIASQTNLLALNATIEAARAGEAGKGFAVVASEVKSLATQTGKATEEIAAQVAGMQQVTGEAVSAIDGIGGTIANISQIATTIASAVEEQGAATAEISRNVQQAASGTSSVSENIGGVSGTAERTGEAASQVLQAAARLTEQADALRRQVDRFLDEVRAA
jgi:methyl-accepting chemotaxis protein